MKINTNTKPRPRKNKFTGILIDRDAWEDEERPEYVCNCCYRLLVRLSNNDKNESWFCRFCSIEFLDKTETRKKSKLGTQRKEVEPAITSTGTLPDISIRHEPELKGGALALSKKGTIRFTHYEERKG
jgi:hypothetical protein